MSSEDVLLKIDTHYSRAGWWNIDVGNEQDPVSVYFCIVLLRLGHELSFSPNVDFKNTSNNLHLQSIT